RRDPDSGRRAADRRVLQPGLTMLEPMPFALQATSADPTHAELAVSLARAFGPVDAAALDDAIERLAAAVPVPAGDDPLEELAALSARIRTDAWPRAAQGAGPWSALLPSALARGPAHPLTLCLLVSEVA